MRTGRRQTPLRDAGHRILEAAIPSIRAHCIRKWYNLEYQDRASEACLIFLEDLRTMPLDSGHFLEDHRAGLDVKMREINRRAVSLRFGRCPLGGVFSRKTGAFVDGYRFKPSSLTDPSVVFVADFVRSLPPCGRQILTLLLAGFQTEEVSKMLRISMVEFDLEMEEIRRLYRLWDRG